MPVNTYRTIHHIPSHIWDAATHGAPFASAAWFATLEAIHRHLAIRYAVLWQDGAPWAAATFCLEPAPDLPAPGWAQPLLHRYLSRHPLLIANQPLIARSGLFLPKQQADQAMRQLVAAGLDLARQLGSPYLVCDWLPPGTASVAQSSKLPTYTYSDHPSWELSIGWPSLAAYLNSLPSKRRKDLRRDQRRAKDEGLCIELPQDASQHSATVNQLVQRIHVAHETPMPFREGFVAALAARPAHAQLLLAKVGDQTVGCGFILMDKKQALLRILGLDHAHPSSGYAYRSLFLRAIQYAIERGAQALDAGSTADKWKRRLGFQPIHTAMTFAAPGQTLDRLGRWLVRWM